MRDVVTSVGFKVLLWSKEDTEEERRRKRVIEDRLWTLRSWMHWLMNSAADAWRYAEKRASTRNPDKLVKDRGVVTTAVKDACESQRAYALSELEKALSGIEKLRVKLGSAKKRGKESEILKVEKDLANEILRSARLRDASELMIPSGMRDLIVVRSEDAYKKWSKERGKMAYPSFRYGQPIRWRDGDWTIKKAEGRGLYRLIVPVGGEKSKIERFELTIVPDSGSAHGFAKMMVDGDAKLCDAKLVYSEKKRQWFAGLTIRYQKAPPPVLAAGARAALRLGVHNAVILAFEDGTPERISGADLIDYKRKLVARYTAIQRHLRSREAGTGARGRGKKRRFKALAKLSEREEAYVNTKIGQWACLVLSFMKERGAKTLYVALDSEDMRDARGDERIAAFLGDFPRAKLRDAIERVLAEAGMKLEKRSSRLDAKTCPACKHHHAERPKGETFHCEVCGAVAPADAIAAWNLVNEVVGGDVPFREMLKRRRDWLTAMKEAS